jgi:ribosomal protein S12 methylthiotransferase
LRYFLDSHGCAKNQVDAETMMAALDRDGWTRADGPESADLLIVNSCGFIESAKKESIDAALELRAAYPGKKLMMAGCLSQRYADELDAELGEVDLFFGNADPLRIVEAARLATGGGGRTLRPAIDPTGAQDFAGCTSDRPLLSLPGSAYLKITEGCDNRCSFCAIPLIRGPLRSRAVAGVVAEARGLLARGVKEICLIGQDLGSYGRDLAGRPLAADLLAELSALPGDFWVRLLYIHPDHFPDGILERCAADPRILPYFDLPFQHASPALLRAMNRRGDPETYLALLAKIRAALPDAVIRSTFLLGFPGETPEDFRTLLDFQAAARLDWQGSFAYSREEGTAAYGLPGRVPKKVVADRLRRVAEAQQAISEERAERWVGRDLVALVEEAVEGEEGLYLGRTFGQAPEVDGATVLSSARPLAAGSFVPARIVRRAGFDLDAVVRHG